MTKAIKAIGNYLARLFSDQTGDPSCKRYMCALFGITAIALAITSYDVTIVGIFVAAAVGENITSVFEKQPIAK